MSLQRLRQLSAAQRCVIQTSLRNVNNRVTLIVPSQMGVRLQRPDIRAHTPWHKIELQGNTKQAILDELERVYRHVRANSLHDCNSERSVGIEATFYKRIKVHDKAKLLKHTIHKQTLTNRNFISYSRTRAIRHTISAFGIKATNKNIEKALFLQEPYHALLTKTDRGRLLNRVDALGRDFPDEQTTEIVAHTTSKKQVEHVIDAVLDDDVYYQVPLNLTGIAANTSVFSEGWLVRAKGFAAVGALVLYGYLYYM